MSNQKNRKTTQDRVLKEDLRSDHRKKDGKEAKRSLTSDNLLKRGITKHLSVMNFPDKKHLEEEERKYNENEDFTVFLKPQAQKRKIARMLMNIN